MKALCAGHIVYDVTLLSSAYPIENTKNSVDDVVMCGGGQASNAAYLLGLWGEDVSVIGNIGSDEYAKRIIKEFENSNVNITYLKLNDDVDTTTSYVLANKENGSRTILTHTSNNIKYSDIELDFVPDIMLFDGYENELALKLIKKYPHAITVIDAGKAKKNVLELALYCDYVVCSKNFAEDLTGITIDYDNNETILELYKKLSKIYDGKVVVTLEDRGALYEYKGMIKIMPSVKVDAIDSTGAGDIFHGAFVYGIMHNMNYEDIIRISNIAGAISTTRVGGRNSIPTPGEMKRYFNDFE